ncbi:Zn-ribbon domain containing protein [Edwardsiella phage pEt-SU]|uniref:Zn-ribbon domain containing protein n=1 Tax=Edwardsiella phage pEt-SU TaxID=2562142 RepID=A0A4D6DW78_9CAUD|nr:Zn-ribbon domain containing protein [Edwardsiella phage pEt-SU]QBZ70610.1 Zn-ribbon domain containing protein [Edwardsiella phage pEt-SU]
MSTELLKSMYAGVEDISSGVMSEDSIYAAAVMGGEGFLDSVKKGAQATIAWIKQLLNNILDAILFWFGGRDTVKRKLDELKRSKFFSMFKSDITNKVEKVTLPAVAIAWNFVEDIIETEYQDFHNDKLKETPEIRSFFVTVNALADSLSKYCKAAKHSPSEDHLNLEPHLQEVRKCVEAGRKLVTALDKEKEPDQGIIKNINGCVVKLGKATNVMISAMKTVSKGLDELSNKAAAKAIYSRSMQTAIESGSNNRIKSAIQAEIEDSRKSPEEINEIIALLEKDMPDVFDPYEESTLAKELAPKSEWSGKTYELQSAYYMMNGSKKRLHHLRDIRNYLHENKIDGF